MGNGSGADRVRLRATLIEWKSEPQLVGIRDAGAQLWTKVETAIGQ
jgi:hypothetical protein